MNFTVMIKTETNKCGKTEEDYIALGGTDALFALDIITVGTWFPSRATQQARAASTKSSLADKSSGSSRTRPRKNGRHNSPHPEVLLNWYDILQYPTQMIQAGMELDHTHSPVASNLDKGQVQKNLECRTIFYTELAWVASSKNSQAPPMDTSLWRNRSDILKKNPKVGHRLSAQLQSMLRRPQQLGFISDSQSWGRALQSINETNVNECQA